MGNIISILQDIFMMTENNSTRVVLSEFKTNPYTEPKKVQKMSISDVRLYEKKQLLISS